MITKLVCKDLSVLLAPCPTLGPKRTFAQAAASLPLPTPCPNPSVPNPRWLQGVAQPLMKINCNQCASWAAINCTKSSRAEPRRDETSRVESGKWKWAKETATATTTATGRRLPARPTENLELRTMLVAVLTVAPSHRLVHKFTRPHETMTAT